MKGFEIDEKAAILEIDHGMSRADAQREAVKRIALLTRRDAPDAWDRSEARWLDLVADIHGKERTQLAQTALTDRLGVSDWKSITVGQLEDSIRRLSQ
jgi:hypothetical protein